ncbi:MAG: hypothetical protein H6741_22065 [Alphaproteobacteria bacterium]|nr:hypothetical protein [Alphaproteobacteria bacterium]MCB9795399.1 hypothetical protein [Alphaproteobacteria bacterium]
MTTRPGPTEALWNAIHGYASPIVVVFFADFGLREHVMEELELLADVDWEIRRVKTVEEALEAPPSSMVLLIPDDEVQAVQELAGARDNLIDREVPLVLLLLRDREGATALASSISLSSWVRGNAVDPEMLAEVDIESERADFRSAVGMTPEQWLHDHRETGSQNLTDLSRTYRALLLEQSDVG